MDPKWVGFIVFIAIIMAVVGAYAQGMTLSTNPESSTIDPDINTIMSYVQHWQANPGLALVDVPAHFAYFSALFHMLIAQHNLHAVFPKDSQWMWSWIILWTPIIATVVFGVIILFIAIIFRYIGT
jgi:hypothetical protein